MTARIGKRFWRISVVVLILALPIYYYTRGGTDAARFVTAQVTRGPIVVLTFDGEAFDDEVVAGGFDPLGAHLLVLEGEDRFVDAGTANGDVV